MRIQENIRQALNSLTSMLNLKYYGPKSGFSIAEENVCFLELMYFVHLAALTRCQI